MRPGPAPPPSIPIQRRGIQLTDPAIPGHQNVVRIPDDYFMPGRFAGRTVIVTGSARSMGELAARRLAREGANVFGGDMAKDAVCSETGSTHR